MTNEEKRKKHWYEWLDEQIKKKQVPKPKNVKPPKVDDGDEQEEHF